jgi:hypothetical protein
VDGKGASNEVLSTVLDAVNIGFRVLIVDALCSSSDAGPRRADDDVPPAFQ